MNEFEEDNEKVFVLRNLVEVRIPKEDYETLSEEYSKGSNNFLFPKKENYE